MSQTSDAPIVAYMDPEEGIPMNAGMWTEPGNIFYGQPIPDNLVPLTQADLNGPGWTVTI